MALPRIEVETVQPKATIKIALLGDSESGKTALALRLAYKRFHPGTETTIGMAFSKRIVSYNQESIGIEFWDISGNQRYEGLIPVWVRNVPYVILCVDPSKNAMLSYHLNLIKKIKTNSPKAHICIAITKDDLKDTDKYPFDEIKVKNMIEKLIDALELDLNTISIHSVSAKNGNGISELFVDILSRCTQPVANLISRSTTPKTPKSSESEDTYKILLAPLKLKFFNDHDNRANLIRIVLLWALNEGNISLAELIIKQQKNWMEGKLEAVPKEIINANLPNFEENKLKYQLYLFSPSRRNDSQKIKNGKSEFYYGLCEVEQSIKKLKA